jgi:hypothetical protein
VIPTRHQPFLVALATLAVASLGANSARAITPDSTDARAISQAVESRDDGDRVTAELSMTISDDGGRTRTRRLRQFRLKFGEGKKLLLQFEAPADMRNTSFLSFDYRDDERDDDQWLYLPSLHKTTRIASGNTADSFLGSDMSFADLTSRNVDKYDHRLLERSVQVDGEDCWLVESTPRNEREQKRTGYLKTHSWISKSKVLVIRAKSWLASGKKLKYTRVADIRNIDGVWTPHEISVKTVRDGSVISSTVLRYSSVKYGDPGVTSARFNEAGMREQG